MCCLIAHVYPVIDVVICGAYHPSWAQDRQAITMAVEGGHANCIVALAAHGADLDTPTVRT